MELNNEQLWAMNKILVTSLLANLELLSQGRLPKLYPNMPLQQYLTLPNGNSMNIREKYIEQCGFALLAENWIKPLAKWIGDRPCLEVMAGCGSLTYFLSEYGVKIKATDNYSWDKKFPNKYTEVENLDAIEATRRYGDKVKFIICSWPYMDSTATRVLLEMRKVNKQCRMIYIGEGRGGCTADDSFFNTAIECEVNGFDEAVSTYRHWYCIHDTIKLIK